ncbi:hypothetical protein GLOTRDRAFT_29854 [Gloeophyllum trabeum ATCC 11539]|uniref:Uncharacterized protein n=1 Tax=Gloeophyllum trabeum (strain ATCC 11539 / FP-39264 / Madison 617) TaxID=670483 RepID=S7QPE4_GLOTA|nr:uncharacterized protein GLOTRDRAFT_29854 [Gloeophyllum trabeum ATCC 11539]EPQ61398.1 hypothetical protein GLOTRDRAFT_29854 [Gloeophyllum trabeum ATCC 11539]
MPRKPKTIPGPSRLSKILEQLRKPPVPALANVRGLTLTYALRNDDFGARHFVKESLPRIRYANPAMDIKVNKLPKGPEDKWEPTMELQLRGGQTKTLNLAGKWSTSIFEELMNTAGGESWEEWKKERQAKGLPIIEGLEAAKFQEKMREQRLSEQPTRPRKAKSEEVDPLANLQTKTGAAAILP